VHRLRADADAIAVGIGTALADDPELTVRHGRTPRVPPLRVVFDGSARLPVDSKLARTARDIPVALVCRTPEPARAAALEGLGVTLIQAATTRDALVALRARGVRSLLVEGGATLAAALVRDAQVDRLVIFRAPLVLGAGSLNAFGSSMAVRAADAPRWRLVEARRFGDDEMTVYAPPP
jgi:diaminohydroxyphosphoribosylaminopyrimidine deaminase/5-amino-6-(5-phosphoribosylamino)uracil reductase